eukprot:1365664-Heterocapsa_arctica.AAC.1
MPTRKIKSRNTDPLLAESQGSVFLGLSSSGFSVRASARGSAAAEAPPKGMARLAATHRALPEPADRMASG